MLRGSTLFDFLKKAHFIMTVTESPDRIGVSREMVFGSHILRHFQLAFAVPFSGGIRELTVLLQRFMKTV